jgi:hypothetical protein
MLLVVFSVALATASWAQNVGQPGGDEAPIHFSKKYDLKTVETLSGEVMAVQRFSSFAPLT